jgi:hypothetical protein
VAKKDENVFNDLDFLSKVTQIEDSVKGMKKFLEKSPKKELIY